MSYSKFTTSIEKHPKDINPDETQKRMIHAALGISGESGELVDAIKKHAIYGKPLDAAHVIEECGDVLYYMSNLLNTIGSNIPAAIKANKAKLSKRYSKGTYSNEQALARADKETK
jgi:NTP pyrophosphatase (non-canonical NTP hydrolase)